MTPTELASPSSHPPRTRAARALWPLAVTGPLAVVALARLFAHDALLPLAWANSLTAWLYLPAWALAVHGLVRRRWVPWSVAAFVCVCHVAWVAPTLVARADEPAPLAPRLRVVTANLLFANPRAAELVEELAGFDADVVVLQEVSPPWLAVLSASALWERYPHRELDVRRDAFGIAVLSRTPFVDVQIVDLEGVPMVDATLEVEGRSVRVLGVHTLPPIDGEYARVWRRQLALLAEHAAGSDLPLVVAGDLNATTHSAGVAALRGAGLRDVHAELGRGLATTWPNGTSRLPSLHLDHVLVSRELTPVLVREGLGAGSDHRPVVADLALAPGPQARPER